MFIKKYAHFFLFGLISALFVACTPAGRDVTVISAHWTPMSTEIGTLNIQDNLELLSDEEKELLLQDESLDGFLDVRRYTSTGAENSSRIVLILQSPVREPIRLPVPNDTAVIYIQEADGWKMIPEDTPTLNMYLRLETRVEGKITVTEAILELPGGGGELLGGIGWGE